MDHRFKISRREAWLGTGLAVLNFVWWYAFAYGLGSKPVKEYTYILGLPAWFFYSCVAGFLLFSFLVFLMVTFLFKEVPFDEPEEKEKERVR
ncbi:Sodium/pantothenate symporter [Fictibacillus macauensis ZFHKF-1]|uniref:Sodium/pantothenate symporter n=1 Tax=Fictibacillus macauensis ZFHKF-1 TaxID=1196324 RepID=I8UAS5_9BACL|nr:YhdT family protein [Fictibacillus macauensis]EIT83908.1 Sodium/pantothenate symporter [Fictibacillus macauensis ZFHKF-1]